MLSSTTLSSSLDNDVVDAATKKSLSSTKNDMQLLTKWIEHNDHKYHVNMLSPKIAYEIRIALIKWYRTNRRKLPWRGDSGPYDGSTVGYGAAVAAKNGTKWKIDKGEGKASTKDIRSFFATSIPSSSKRAKTCDSKAATTKKQLEEEDSSYTTVAREVTAYGIWVSEIMLQQTRVEAVIPYWLKFMSSFPTVYDLALATDEQINSHWAGLGFYRRARLLHTGAKRVVNDYNGIVPDTVDELMKIEGIGRYTASAIASMAYGVELPVVDGNVCRVLSRLTGIANHIKAGVMKDDLGWILAEKVVQSRPHGVVDDVDYEIIGSPGEINQALMELGATYCSPNGSGVDADDPLKDFYVSTQLGVAIGRVMCDGSAIDRSHVQDLLTSKFVPSGNKGCQFCRLCDPNGVSTAFDDIIERISNNSTTQSMTHQHRENVFSIAGHSALPICPPKKSKREEVIAVAVMTSNISGKGRCWLMVKRPSDGLLAGQWEFPSVCMWNSAEQAKGEKGKGTSSDMPLTAIEVPLVDPKLRSIALNSFLFDAFKPSGMNKRKQLNESIVHIFSHVRHTMWIEHGEFKESVSSERWKLNDGREIGWMTEGDMINAGITVGVRKILAITK